MLMFTRVVVHYSEIALKGANRRFFEKKLAENIAAAINIEPRIEHGRLVMDSVPENMEEMRSVLSCIPGISWFAFCIECKPEIDIITEKVLSSYSGKGSLKVEAVRSDKNFTLTSIEVNKHVGGALFKKGFTISMNPENRIFIEISYKNAFIFFEKIKGIGGLPVGSSGKVLVLLSGGIDSPVASYLMARRGCSVELMHFHGLSSSAGVKQSKITVLAKHLKNYAGPSVLHIIPFDEFHVAALSLDPKYEMVMFRRFMFLVAERLAQRIGAKAIVTGDNIGQVASQTLENIASVDSGLSMPVIRPLAGHDKNEIIAIAKEIGTFSASLEKYKDCCSLVAKHPETRSNIEEVKSIEKKINMEKIIEESLKRMETIDI